MDYVTIYKDPNFGGQGFFFDVGDYPQYGTGMYSSIQVPAGLVALVFQHADSGGGYGISADFLEDCTDLAPLNLNEISYISVFRAEQPSGLIWRRGAYKADGEYVAGHWERKRVQEPLANSVVAVSPPIPPHTGGIEVHADGQYAQKAQFYTVSLRGPDNPTLPRSSGRFDATLTCKFCDLPVGRYWVNPDSKVDSPEWSVTPDQAEVDLHTSQTALVLFRFGDDEHVPFPGKNVRDHRAGS